MALRRHGGEPGCRAREPMGPEQGRQVGRGQGNLLQHHAGRREPREGTVEHRPHGGIDGTFGRAGPHAEPEPAGAGAGGTARSSPRASLYPVIRSFFRGCVGTFYATIDAAAVARVPGPGQATMLVFNHGNGLVDAGVLVATVGQRTIRFLAKDTLWGIPFW